ncbi:hypothetical protein GIB67_009760 [Kingdonia uniflora]|uniref:DYW domain-containing protein n=1 Tax=Kingdonia uniflora TaxID=39325 RepID=A0A7J7LBB9_9MAGN|nr:hypothetical protein GIB67_009760 [Kingdonia uniflora]
MRYGLWTALIVGHAQNGKGQVSLQLYDHIIRSSIEPDFVTFVGLLFACNHTGLMEDDRSYFKLTSKNAQGLGIGTKNHFELEPRSSMPYVKLSIIYSAAGKWDELARIRSLMKSIGVSKEPGYNWIEINNKMHTFMVEDRSHPRMSDNIPSKKLAIAYRLLAVPAGVLRIFKNLRVCGDFHSAIKASQESFKGISS